MVKQIKQCLFTHSELEARLVPITKENSDRGEKYFWHKTDVVERSQSRLEKYKKNYCKIYWQLKNFRNGSLAKAGSDSRLLGRSADDVHDVLELLHVHVGLISLLSQDREDLFAGNKRMNSTSQPSKSILFSWAQLNSYQGLKMIKPNTA